MATRSLRSCDTCGVEERSGKRPIVVLRLDIKRSDGLRTVGDMCVSCLDDMASRFNLVHTAKRRRNAFKVTPFEEIPQG
jgi:hypothetical protein